MNIDDNASVISTTSSKRSYRSQRSYRAQKKPIQSNYQERLSQLEQQETNEEDVITNAFKGALKEYIEIDNDLKDANKHLRVLRNRKKELGGQIQVHMKEFSIAKLNLPLKVTPNPSQPNIPVTNLKVNELKLNERVAKRPINKALILERLTLYFKGDEQKATQLTEFICDDEARKIGVKFSLTRRVQTEK